MTRELHGCECMCGRCLGYPDAALHARIKELECALLVIGAQRDEALASLHRAMEAINGKGDSHDSG